jgi:hypothetical protein
MWMGGKVPLGYDVRDRKLVVNEAEAARVRRVFELFAETGSGVETVRRLRAEGVAAKSGRPLDKGDVYKLLHNRTYAGEVAHKGQVYPGEHEAIVPRELWDRAHASLQVSPRARANRNRNQVPALLKGLIFGADGRALSPTHCRRRGRLYRYYVAQRVLKGDAAAEDGIVRRVSAAEIEAAVVGQVRALLRQPEVVVGTWLAARAEAPDLTEAEVREALERLDPLWDELFPAEQARIMRLLVERVEVGPAGAGIRGPAVRGSPLQAEADLEADLVLRHLAVLHAAPDLSHLEPFDVAQGLGRACDGGLDRLGDRLVGAADEIGLPVHMIVLHRCSPWQLLAPLASSPAPEEGGAGRAADHSSGAGAKPGPSTPPKGAVPAITRLRPSLLRFQRSAERRQSPPRTARRERP